MNGFTVQEMQKFHEENMGLDCEKNMQKTIKKKVKAPFSVQVLGGEEYLYFPKKVTSSGVEVEPELILKEEFWKRYKEDSD